MKKLILNCLIFSAPLLVCLVCFTALDPFGIFFKDEPLAEPSNDVVSTRILMNTYKQNNYTAFIFGNSRTHAFRTRDWEKYIGTAGLIFHYGAPGESVLNIKKKLELIADRKIPVKHALILLDAGILQNTDNKHPFYRGPVYDHSPLTSNISTFRFYANHVKYYFEDLFFAKHIAYELTGRYNEGWMHTAFKDPQLKAKKAGSHDYDSEADSLIETDFKRYKAVYHPDYSYVHNALPAIDSVDLAYLQTIRDILESRSVNYRIILPPDFNRQKTMPAIYEQLYAIFEKRLYDFSGSNAITTDSTLHYENLHFTYRAGQLMLDSMYNKKINGKYLKASLGNGI